MRIAHDSQLVLLHLSFNVCYNGLSNMLVNRDRSDISVEVSDRLSETLEECLRELREKLCKNETLYPTIEKFAASAYVASGGGYYSTLYNQYLATKKGTK